MNSSDVLRQQLLELLGGGNAHMRIDQAVADFPIDRINQHPGNSSYTPWRLLEHIRIAQWDILEFIRDPAYVSPPWPSGYWPAEGEQADAEKWQKTIRDFNSDHQALIDLVADPKTDLTSNIPHVPGYTILREILVVSDHNSYHLGEFGLLRQVIEAWPDDRQG
ncbi:MAG: DinB family protein [Omnitrophica WOR_2 bacterium]